MDMRVDDNGKILILSVSDNEEHILEKILKAVEGSVDIEERTLPSKNQVIKSTNIGRMNNIQACARESVDKELIYQKWK